MDKTFPTAGLESTKSRRGGDHEAQPHRRGLGLAPLPVPRRTGFLFMSDNTYTLTLPADDGSLACRFCGGSDVE